MDDIGYDLFDPAWRADCARIWKRLRDDAPVYRAPSGCWVVSRYADVVFILKHPELFSSRAIQGEAFGLEAMDPETDSAHLKRLLALVAGLPLDLNELMNGRMIASEDPPRHTYLRQIGNRGFSQRRLAQWEDRIREVVAGCLAGIDPGRGFDVVRQLSGPVPTTVIAEILGVEPERHRDLKSWADDVVLAGFGPERGTPAAQIRMIEALKGFSSYFVPLIERRKEEPGEDMISDLVREGQADGALTPTETVMFILMLILGGNETTRSVISNTIVELMRHPDQVQLLAADPSLIPNAVEESLRFRTPAQYLWREANEDVELAGMTIEKGDKLAYLLGAANRDERRFERPDEFDITRDTSGHLGFGHGIHYCIGAGLGRMEAKIILEGLVDDLPNYRMDEDDLELIAELALWGYKRVELVPV